jgi:hypothetical protein
LHLAVLVEDESFALSVDAVVSSLALKNQMCCGLLAGSDLLLPVVAQEMFGSRLGVCDHMLYEQ